MTPNFLTPPLGGREDTRMVDANLPPGDLVQAEKALQELADVFLNQQLFNFSSDLDLTNSSVSADVTQAPLLNMEAKYRALVEQIPAVVFMAYLDKGIGEAYVSPQIEAALGFTQDEWLEDPVRWYDQIYPDDKQRWSTEAAEMF